MSQTYSVVTGKSHTPPPTRTPLKARHSAPGSATHIYYYYIFIHYVFYFIISPDAPLIKVFRFFKHGTNFVYISTINFGFDIVFFCCGVVYRKSVMANAWLFFLGLCLKIDPLVFLWAIWQLGLHNKSAPPVLFISKAGWVPAHHWSPLNPTGPFLLLTGFCVSMEWPTNRLTASTSHERQLLFSPRRTAVIKSLWWALDWQPPQ